MTPPTPQQELGQRLREVRTAAGLQAKQVAEIVGITAALASRFETGQRWPSPEHVKAWAQATKLDTAGTDQLLELLTEARGRDKNQKTAAPYGPKAAQIERNRMLKGARTIQSFAVTEIPFYLQSRDYARQEVGNHPDADAIADLRRNAAGHLDNPTKVFRIILAESALRFLPCDPATMRGQIGQLHGLIDARIEFGIVPFGVEIATPLKNAFTIFGDVTVVDTFAGEVKLTPKETTRYLELGDGLWADAVTGDEARALLTAAANALPAS